MRTPALTATQLHEFADRGLVRLPGAITRADADAMANRLWGALARRDGIRRDAPETWKLERPAGFQALERSGAFAAMGSPAVRGALDALLGLRAWAPPARWGQVLATFPDAKREWDVPHRQWHLDLPAAANGDGLPCVRVFAALAPLRPRGGGTLFLAGSHLLCARLARGRARASAEMRRELARSYPWLAALFSAGGGLDRIAEFMTRGAVIDGVALRVIEMTAEPGDVVIMHPALLHAPTPNCLDTPRLVLVQAIYRGL